MLTRTLVPIAVACALAVQVANAASVPTAENALQGRATSSKKNAKHPHRHAKAKHPKKKHPHPHPHVHPHPHPHPHPSPAGGAKAQPTVNPVPTSVPTPNAVAPPVIKSKIVCTSPFDSTDLTMFNIPYDQYYNDVQNHARPYLDNPSAMLTVTSPGGTLESVSTNGGPYYTVDMLSCTSTYMGYDSFAYSGIISQPFPFKRRSREDDDAASTLTRRVRDQVWYGIARVNGLLDTCLTAYKPYVGEDRVAYQFTPCTYDDDESQVAQFFRTTRDGDGNKVAQFLGARFADTNDQQGLHYNIVRKSARGGCPLGSTIRPDSSTREASFYLGKPDSFQCCA